MATLASTVSTLVDVAKRMDPDGKVATVAELLSQTNRILDDMLWKEGNLPTGERVTVRTGLPTAFWRLANQAVATSKSTTAQYDEHTGMLESWAEIDKDVVELNGNSAAYRMSENMAFIESMNQEFAQTLFYGNSALNPEEFNGLHSRYSSLTAENGENIINGDSGADAGITSVWLVVWGPNTVYGVYPKGSKAGLDHMDLGLQVVEGSTGIGGTRMLAYRDRWQWKCGVVVKDWRYVARLANIDVSDLASNSSAVDLGANMVKMIHRIPNLDQGRPVFYMNRTAAQALDLQARSSVSGGALTTTFSTQYGANSYSNFEGRPVMTFRGIPVKTVDAILTSESLLS